MRIGASYLGEGRCEFVVWAPRVDKLEVRIPGPGERLWPMDRDARGYWRTRASGIEPGTDYLYRLDGKTERPDPASAFQPEGVHGPSRVIDHSTHSWSDADWCGRPLPELVIYELHVGTFTPEGTFDAVIPRLPELAEMGITAIELMPVAAFPGERNWGYDGVQPFAVQKSYGGPEGLRRLVDACHRSGLAVVLDVVYNHLGPEGNYLREFGPYFTDHYRTPWGEAVNFDGPGSDEVRGYFIENARHWFFRYHIDALRLDAIHAIYDFSARPFLRQLTQEAETWSAERQPPCLLIAESDLNDSRIIRSPRVGGCGLDAQWNDDLHHAIHTLITGEQDGYYRDFGRAADLATALREGYAYSWRYSPYRRRHHGNSAADLPGKRFVVAAQNHDQIGNRLRGERLITLAGFAAAKLAAAAVMLSPFVPLLFMGEEYGETNPFLFFVSFGDPHLIEAVRQGRKEEFSAFGWQEEPPDPQAQATIARSKLDWSRRYQGQGKALTDCYRELLRLRRELPALADLGPKCPRAEGLEEAKLVWFERRSGSHRALVLLNFAARSSEFAFPETAIGWQKRFDSADLAWLGPGPTLPEVIRGQARVAMPALSSALYLPER